jgi:quercetin dioxygenase-like cupin family protein
MPSFEIRRAEDSVWASVAPGIRVRDLRLAELNDGAWTLQLVRLEGEGARVEAMHRHEEGFSLAYVLCGWLDVEFEQIGHVRLAPGAVIPAYNGPMHRERDCGDGLELMLLVTQQRVSDEPAQHIVVQQADDAPYVANTESGWSMRDFALEAHTGGRLAARALCALPGVKHVPHWLAHAGCRELLYVVQGECEVEGDNGQRASLRVGDVLHIAPPGRHRLISRTDDALIIAMALP